MVHPFAQAIASGTVGALRTKGPGFPDTVTAKLAHSAFVSGLNEILFVAAFVLFAGAVLAFLLVRQQDFVASGPSAAG